MAKKNEIVKDIYAAINREDIPGALVHFDAQVFREEFGAAETYRGLDEVGAHLAKGRGTWAEGTCEPEQIIVMGDKAVVYLHVHVRLKANSEWVEGRFADGFVFRGEKAIEWRSFAQRDEALEWAGL